MKPVRCAIYTRKSSDEGLEQSFNSLDAQREACGAYILSQASEGWIALPEVYDDGGLSGGTLERPALKRLLAEVAAGRVDIIVVYKVDRLTRSLFDFAKLVETFDAAGTSFVSVTQSFNTTTSMGRLTLNMLLSFAQFEREVTAERIRDKIAASKARGMWMGGTPPLGYEPNDRTLTIVEEHAALIRHIFTRYLALGSVRRLQEELAAERTTIPSRVSISGKPLGGGAFTRGQLYAILKNVIYQGKIGHKDKIYSGLHEPIIDEDTFAATQAMLADHLQGHRSRAAAAETSPLAGRIVDDAGEPLVANHACKGKVRHRYYVSRALQHATATTGLRVPAREIERLVADAVADLFTKPFELAAAASLDLPVHQVEAFHARAAAMAATVTERRSPILTGIINEVKVGDRAVTLTCETAALADALQIAQHADAPATIEISCPARLIRSGRALRLVQDNGAVAQATPDKALVRLLVQARRWWTILRAGDISISQLAGREGVTSSYISRVVRLAFLAPSVTDAILAGRQRAGVTAASLTLEGEWPSDWNAQAVSFLPAKPRLTS
ncbi:DNA invertase Pin-like site-specific DNA recombinase [Sphingomonas jinjuensis]|uniref:DNA invertase Pin-like site-specific DNA recombinase n=1 Tax=Sphingomonas jinjuensis TaxID=535907 RepID=A0A840F888_9SPHN|nr:recombinase family protein [Sphingomonas jinjuensis]MBB4152741.1 DNA invertase Pin-like site-specific DNA recombinase [Sphingomonas jinjuensis]